MTQYHVQSKDLNEPSGLLLTDPPARAARWSGWLLLSLALASAIFIVGFKLPETVIVPFAIVAEAPAAPLQTPVDGELVMINAVPGAMVKAGTVLFRIRNDEMRERERRRVALQDELVALAERVAQADLSHAAEVARDDAQILLSRRELAFRAAHHAATVEILKRKEKAAADGLLPQISLLSDRLVLAESENAEVLSEKLLQQLLAQREARIHLRQQLRADEQLQAEKLRLSIGTLVEALRNTEGDTVLIRAPHDAVVLDVAEHSVGSVLTRGERLCQLAPAGSKTQAQLNLAQADLPRLKSGQPVRLFLSAFPYQRYGSVAAQLRFVSPMAVNTVPGEQFFAYATLQPGAQLAAVRIGMTGEARILVGRRSILARFMDPLRGIKERAFVE